MYLCVRTSHHTYPDSDMTDYMNSSSRNESEESFLSTGFTKWPPVVGSCSSESFAALLCSPGTLGSIHVESDVLKSILFLFFLWSECFHDKLCMATLNLEVYYMHRCTHT